MAGGNYDGAKPPFPQSHLTLPLLPTPLSHSYWGLVFVFDFFLSQKEELVIKVK